MTRTHHACLPAVVLAMLLGGCNAVAFFGYLFAPEEPKEKVEAEFSDLARHKIAVVVYAREGIHYEYPEATLELSEAVCRELRERLTDVATVDPRLVRKYQYENLHWDAMGRTRLGEALGADYVLLVTLVEFSTRLPGSLELYRGRVTAEASLYDVARVERRSRVWEAPDIRVAYPAHETLVGQAHGQHEAIRQRTVRRFATALVRHFYKHEVPKT